ncbi:site-specific tyrosine recombinase XerD [Gemmata sp. SH-PL17]|uniref:tyrosine-type recombinase/integrase n=1 Tax=Gemmata sp. SH-PL17 TaxID=1630693 RepID=UPI00078E0274|nr:site-specific integrase [Gemmata sp. SH-PL17]AMV26103.1 site-specific tyrosine recombinase XerD [Gemmata sp. SH-PL17]
MARPKNQIPTYKLHGTTGLARCWVNGKWVSLGKYGSPESRSEFARILAELATGSALAASAPHRAPKLVTLDELCLAFFKHAQLHYRRADGTVTGEVREFKYAIRFAHELYGAKPAVEFGPLALEAVRHKMVEAGWARALVNRRVERIRRVFKWGVSKELVPVTTYQALRALQGLQRGRTKAKESPPVKPARLAHVEAALPFMNDHVRALVQFQLYTGCRPGEACMLSMDQIVEEQGVWLFRPSQHKTRHRDRERVIVIGPRARAVLEEFLRVHSWSVNLPLFNPAVAETERQAARTAARKKVWRSQPRVKNRKVQAPRAYYTTTVLANNVRRACDRAGVPRFAPNMIRHLFATEVRRDHGLEAAQVLLGHSRADVTQVYAERDLARALQVAREVG